MNKIRFGEALAECLGEQFSIPETVHPWARRLAHSVLADAYIAGITPRYVDCPFSPEDGQIPDWIIVRGYQTTHSLEWVEVAFPTAVYNEIDEECWEKFSLIYVELACKHRRLGGNSDEN